MNAEDRRLLGLTAAGMPPCFDDVWVELADGTRVEVTLHTSDLPDDARTLIDAVPALLADRAALEVKVELYGTALRAIARRHGDTLGVGAILRAAGFELGPDR